MDGSTRLGFWDYMLMFFVSLLAAPVALAVFFAAGAGDLAYLGLAPVIGVYQLVFAVPLAIVGLPLIHLISRAVPSEAVQVVVAGVVPPLLLLGYAELAHLGNADGLFAMAGMAAGVGSAVGRAVVGRLARPARRRQQDVVSRATLR